MHKVSRPVAEKLKEAGYPQYGKGFFYDMETQFVDLQEFFEESEHNWGQDFIRLPTLGELIRQLPDGYFVRRFADKTTIYYDDGIMKRICEAATPEDAAALCWLALKKAQKD